MVALFTRAWIEITTPTELGNIRRVALFTRAWIEIGGTGFYDNKAIRRPLHEGVD